MPESSPPEPPQPPQGYRRVALGWTQILGVGGIAIIPLLALFGLFGVSDRAVSTSGTGIRLSVRHPDQLRYKVVAPFHVELFNTSTAPADVEVTIARSYLDHFSSVQFTPEPHSVSAERARFRIDQVPGNGSAAIVGELQGDAYGSASGMLTAQCGGERVSIPLRTFTYP